MAIPRTTDTKREFFFENSKILGLGRQIGPKFFGVFSADLAAIILELWVPFPCCPLINYYFYKKPSIYIQIPTIYLDILVEFGKN
jgi:hypothetical protein